MELYKQENYYQIKTDYITLSQILTQYGLDINSNKNCQINEQQIIKDLQRIPFIDLMTHSYQEYTKFWLQQNGQLHDNIADITGNITGIIVTNFLIETYIKSCAQYQNNKENYDIAKNFLKNNKQFEFTCMNDRNEPCSFAVSYNPFGDVFCIALITNPHLQNKQVYLFLSEHLVKHYELLQQQINMEKLTITQLATNIAQITAYKNINLLLSTIIVNTDVKSLNSIDYHKLTEFGEKLNSIKNNSNNNEFYHDYLNFQHPEQLRPDHLMIATLHMFAHYGFSVTPVHFTIKKQNIDDENSFYYYLLKNGNLQIALFPPSKDIDDTFENNINMLNHPYILDTQKIAQRLIDQGITCILPTCEFDAYKFLGQQTLNSLYNFFVPKKTEQSDCKSQSILSRMHWVLLIWNHSQMKFYDPKSSQYYILKYGNDVFKKFATNAGYKLEQYETQIKESHDQKILNFNDCGYYCFNRIHKTINDLLLQKESLTKDDNPILETIHKEWSIYYNSYHQDLNMLTNFDSPLSFIMDTDSKKTPPEFTVFTKMQWQNTSCHIIEITDTNKLHCAYEQAYEQYLLQQKQYENIIQSMDMSMFQ